MKSEDSEGIFKNIRVAYLNCLYSPCNMNGIKKKMCMNEPFCSFFLKKIDNNGKVRLALNFVSGTKLKTSARE